MKRHGRISITVGAPLADLLQEADDSETVGISRIPRSFAAQLINKTVPIPDDPGYYAVGLKVFHQLHCLVSSQPHNFPIPCTSGIADTMC